ncbi:MAG: hypothetical protein BGO26_08535 [Actinobacteria bacterium 69-20]|nr:RNA methyltransferase [Actinomycetota bacterium]OJV30346.1 MAG: hypothetical protein BGO26_08535 [Actinobacteria bacterium 69-20]
MPDLVTSFANPIVKRYRALAARKVRRRESCFVVEGLQPVWRAVASPWDIDTLIVAPDLLTNEAARRMVDGQREAGCPVLSVSREVFAHLSDRDGPAGLAAIVRGSVDGVERFRPPSGRPVVALHQVGNPGNIGAILRSADAAGAGGVMLVGACADPLAPAAVKASMGSVFAVPMAHAESVDDLFGWSESHSRPVVAVTGNTRNSLWRTAVDARSVLLFGSEGDGLPADLVARCAASVAIPMEGTAESLNLATAASVALFELARRRDQKDRV